MQQTFASLPPARSRHGGNIRKGKRKLERPIDPKRPLHLVLKSSRARRAWSLIHRRNKSKTSKIIYGAAQKHGIGVVRYANAGNHLHLLVRTENRQTFQRFLREISGRIAMSVTKARKGRPAGRFWDHTAFTRIVNWGRDLDHLVTYFIKNLFEGAGFLTPELKEEGYKVIRAEARAGPS